MNPQICLIFLIFLSFFVSCSKKIEQDVVYLEDSKGQNTETEIIIDDNTLAAINKSKLQSVNREPKTNSFADGSTATESFDSAGNKTESRCFDNHPRIGCVVLNTTAKGEKTINIFAQNGEVKIIAPDALENVFSLSPDEIAVAAGITEGRRIDQPQLATTQSRPKTPMQPMPSQKFPVYNNSAQPAAEPNVVETETETVEQTTPVTDENSVNAVDN